MNKTQKTRGQKNAITRKVVSPIKLNKCARSRINGMETYKINCGKNLLVGMSSIKSPEETSMHENDFVHVLTSQLKDYNEPVIVKVYDHNNFHLPIELNILHTINGYRNSAYLICDFSCNDVKQKYEIKINHPIRFCGNGNDTLHFFVYEFIKHGDVSDFLSKKLQTKTAITSVILQTTCIIIQLASIYKIYHGDINSGNILINTFDSDIIEYCIEGETFQIESGGIMPKIIDYGQSNFYKNAVSPDEVWFDIILALGVIY